MPDTRAAAYSWPLWLPRHVRILWAVTLVLGVAMLTQPVTVPFNVLMIPMLLAINWLTPRQMPFFVVAILTLVTLAVLRLDVVTTRNFIAVATFFVIGVSMLFTSYRRERLGVAQFQGESMLVDLRNRLQRSSLLPDLPPGWDLQAAQLSANRATFSGDFVTVHLRQHVLQIAVVDVSGSGVAAGTRSMLMNGAIGGLLGAVPPERFLPAANDYLNRQAWEEGFATAVHLVLDLRTGEFQVRSAGHPPAAQLRAGSGRWHLQEAEGPVLGVVEDATFQPVSGRLTSGDWLLMFTDGMVESAKRDLGLGIDRLLAHTERLVHGDSADAAMTLVTEVGVPGDDKALVLLGRA